MGFALPPHDGFAFIVAPARSICTILLSEGGVCALEQYVLHSTKEAPELRRTPSRNRLKRGPEALARYPTEHEKHTRPTSPMPSGPSSNPICPPPRLPGVLRCTAPVRSYTLSSTSFAAAGGCCHTTSRLGRLSTTTSACGAWMALGKRCTPPYAKRVRVRLKRNPQPSAAIVDSQ